MADTPLPSPELLRQLLTYDADTGLLHWRARSRDLFKSDHACNAFNAHFAGRQFGTLTVKGYRQGTLLYKGQFTHRVILAMVNGCWPLQVDHINGRRDDNRLCNLREVTPSENRRNAKKPTSNSSGVMGVNLHKNGKWVARACNKYLGYFSSFEEAVAVRKAAEARLGYHINSGREA